MYVCMYACLHVCMYVCMYVHITYIDASGFLIQSDRAAEKKQKGDNVKDPCHSMSSDEGQCTATAGCEFVTKSGKTNRYTPKKRRRGGRLHLAPIYMHTYTYIHTCILTSPKNRRRGSRRYLSSKYGDAEFSVIDTLRVYTHMRQKYNTCKAD